MARTPMVTRTIITTEVTALCLDVTTAEPCNKTCTLPRTYPNNEKLLKAAKSVMETDTLKVVHIVDTKEVESLYGMTEQEFINAAKPLPPRTKAEVEAESVNNAEADNA